MAYRWQKQKKTKKQSLCVVCPSSNNIFNIHIDSTWCLFNLILSENNFQHPRKSGFYNRESLFLTTEKIDFQQPRKLIFNNREKLFFNNREKVTFENREKLIFNNRENLFFTTEKIHFYRENWEITIEKLYLILKQTARHKNLPIQF